jgi:hypothetical protein
MELSVIQLNRQNLMPPWRFRDNKRQNKENIFYWIILYLLLLSKVSWWLKAKP